MRRRILRVELSERRVGNVKHGFDIIGLQSFAMSDGHFYTMFTCPSQLQCRGRNPSTSIRPHLQTTPASHHHGVYQNGHSALPLFPPSLTNPPGMLRTYWAQSPGVQAATPSKFVAWACSSSSEAFMCIQITALMVLHAWLARMHVAAYDVNPCRQFQLHWKLLRYPYILPRMMVMQPSPSAALA